MILCPGFSSEWTIEADALYWRADEAGLPYAVETNVSSAAKGSKLKEPHFEWDFGFKLAVGYLLPNQWDALLRLTHLHTHADSFIHARSHEAIYPIWISLDTPQFADAIKMHWRLHMGIVDALLAKRLIPNAHFVLIPQGGLRYAVVRQKFNLGCHGGMFTPETEKYVRMKNKFWGIGPYGALGLQWLFSRRFHLCATGGVGAVYGEFYVHEDEDLFKGDVKILGVHEIWWQMAVISDANIVLRWHKVWEKAKKTFEVQLGWDVLLLFKQNRLIRFTSDSLESRPSNLSLRGWEWGFRFSF